MFTYLVGILDVLILQEMSLASLLARLGLGEAEIEEQRNAAFQSLQETWELNGAGINDERGLMRFLREYEAAFTGDPELSLSVADMRRRFVASSSQVCSKDDIEKGRVMFKVNERAEYLRMEPLGSELEEESREALCEILKGSATGQFTYKRLEEIFAMAKRINHSVTGELLPTTLHLIKNDFLLISFVPAEETENRRRSEYQRRGAETRNPEMRRPAKKLMDQETR